MPVAGSHWSSRWWGGPLADGTVVVTNPINPVEGIVDLTASSETSQEMYQPEPEERNFSQWWNTRVSSWGRLPLSVPVAPMRGSLVLVAAAMVMATALWVFTRAPYWAFLIMIIVAALVAAVALIVHERRKLKVEELTYIGGEDRGPLSLLRYVDAPVSDTTQWRLIAALADRLGPSHDASEQVHHLLWDAAEVRAYRDVPEVSIEGLVRLDALAAEAAKLSASA